MFRIMTTKIAEPKDWKELAFLHKIAAKHKTDTGSFQPRVIEGHRYIFIGAAKGSEAISANCIAEAQEGRLAFLKFDVWDGDQANVYSLESVRFERLWIPMAMWLKFKVIKEITAQDLKEDFIKYWKYMQHRCPCHEEAFSQLREKMCTYEGYSGSKLDLKFMDFVFSTEEFMNRDEFFFAPPKDWLSLLRFMACVSHEDFQPFCTEEEASVLLKALQNPEDEATASKFHAIGMKKRVALYAKKLFKVSAVVPEQLVRVALIPPTYFQPFLEKVAEKKGDKGDEKKS